MTPRPICLRCRRLMSAWKTGAVIEIRAESLGDKPYEQWRADTYRCPGCGTEVATRYASEPQWRHFDGERQREIPYASVPERGVHHE